MSTFRPVLASLALLSLVFAPLADPGSSETAASDPCVPVDIAALGPACQMPDGLYRMHLPDGSERHTHGADPIPPGGDTEPLGVSERYPRCATDYYQHVLYGRPANGPDNFATAEEAIRRTINHMNWILNADALESGGVNADYQVLCDADGIMRVDSFVVPSSSSSFGSVVNAAWNAGFRDSRADYTIFYDGTSAGVCGVGHFWANDRPDVHNPNNRGGAYGVTYKNCWTGRTAQHENGHNQGAVQYDAPDSDGAAHCLEGVDIMCYPTSAVLVLCPDRMHFDCDHDTYFDAQSEPGEWLDTHWNIGSRVNRFIAFGDTEPAAPNQEPSINFTYTRDGGTVHLDATGSSDPDGDALAYRWVIEDGTRESGGTLTHTFAGPGIYRVLLIVSDRNGGVVSTSFDVPIPPQVPPSFEQHAYSGRIGCAIGITPISTTDLCAEDGDVHDFRVPIAPGVTGLHVVLTWGAAELPGGVLAARELGYSWVSPSGVPGANGPSPVVGHHDVVLASPLNIVGANGHIDVRPQGLAGPVLEQPFELCVTVLYGGATLPEETHCAS